MVITDCMEAMAEQERQKKEMNKLNLGCGTDYKEGWTNIDIIEPADIILDLNIIPYPLQSNQFDLVLISHVLEHLNNVDNVLKEVHRITKRFGKIIIHAPHWSHPMSFADYSHKRYFSSYSEIHFNSEYFIVKKKYYTFVRTKYHRFSNIISPILNLSHNITELFLSKFIPISQITFELEVIK